MYCGLIVFIKYIFKQKQIYIFLLGRSDKRDSSGILLYPRVKNARLNVFWRAHAHALTAKNELVTRAAGAPGKIKNDKPALYAKIPHDDLINRLNLLNSLSLPLMVEMRSL